MLGALALLTQFTFAQQHISGTLKGAEGKKMYLYSDDDDHPKDSQLIKNSQFDFTMANAEPRGVKALILQDHDNPLLFVSGKDHLEYTLTSDAYPVAASMKGDDESKAMQAYQKAFQPLLKRAHDLNMEAALINGENEEAKQAFRPKADSFNTTVINTGEKFIQGHKSDIAAAWVMMSELRQRLSPEDFNDLYQSLNDNVKDTKYGKAAASYLASTGLEANSSLAPDFSQTDKDGKLVTLSSFRGKYVLVDFWASWCGPCRQENPNVVRAHTRFKDKNFVIIGISLDKDRSSWLDAVEHDKLNWIQLSDLQGWGNVVANLYGINGIPANVLIDPKGRIIARNLRGRALEARLERVLK
jgi:peroxiredoxin